MLTFSGIKWYGLRAALSLWVLLALGSCSSEKSTLVSKTYHNITAHYNAYFYANERLKEIEAAINSSYIPNYNRILHIFAPIDSTVVNGMQAQVDEAIKKAALAIQFHKNSDWVDDSYVLIGKVKYYDSKFEEAIETFKYVNTLKEEDQDANHRGLIALMRAYIDHSELNNAIAVSDFLEKKELNKDNLQDLYLTRAYLYQKRNDLDNMVQNLVGAVELMKPREGSARIYFIIGQVYQALGFDAEAHNNYRQCIKNNPNYELSFYASLNMAQVYELARSNDLKKIRRYYQKILKDAKNREFRDKIYYEMGEFEFKQQELELAIEYYKSSVQASVNNNRQKAYSYLKLGLINYDTLKNYAEAKAYYDSTMMVLPHDEPDYEDISERQKILADFVQQLNTIQLQDSLITLSNMDSLELSALLDSVIVKEERALKAAEEEQRQRQESLNFNRNNNSDPFLNNQTGASWYFYNLSAVSAGQSEFIRKWGNRPLQDHWRRSNKGTRVVPDEEIIADSTDAIVVDEQADPSAQRAAKKTAYYNTIPFTEAQRQIADSLIEVSHYNLGNIYNFQLDEKSNAAETFITMLERYPQTEYKPEILYQLYLIFQDQQDPRSDEFKERLLTEHPNSTFAKTLVNPEFLRENEALALQMQKDYQSAYRLYRQQYYDSAAVFLTQILRSNPDNSFSDNLKLLKILAEGQTGSLHIYRHQLQEFIKQYPDSELNPYAQKLLRTSQELPVKLARLEGAVYQEDLEDNHLFVMVYPRSWVNQSLTQGMDVFITENFEDTSLTTSSLILDEENAMVLVQFFDDKPRAMEFYRKIGAQELMEDIPKDEIKSFIISEKNFTIFYQTKDLPGYQSFFNNYYF